jgi:hypothetical protein
MSKRADSVLPPSRSSVSPSTALAAAMLLAVVVALNFTPWLPLQDFNEWGYQGFIGAQLLQHHLTTQFAFVSFPVPNALIQTVLTCLDLVLAPSASTRLIANLYTVLALALAWALARRYRPAHPTSLFLVLLICIYFNASFWSGYLNFQFGLLIFSAWLLCEPRTRARPAVVLAFSLLAFFTHAIVWGALLLMMGVEACRDRKLLARLPALLSVGLFGWYLVAKAPPQGFASIEHPSLLWTLTYKLYTVAKFGPYHNFVFSDAPHTGIARVEHLAGSAFNLLCAPALIAIVIWALREAWRRKDVTTLASVAALLALYLALPPIVADVINPGERALCLVLLLCFVSAPACRFVDRLFDTLSIGAVVLVICLIGLTRTAPAIWEQHVSVGLPPGGFVDNLFWSRPSAFVAQARAADAGVVRWPLTFHTSLLATRPPMAPAH